MTPAIENLLTRLMEMDPASVFALQDIAAERVWQIEREGWTPERDDHLGAGQLAAAAACYLLAPHVPRGYAVPVPRGWPWDAVWWRPGSIQRNRVRAGAFLVAELARSDRRAVATPRRVDV